MTIFDYLVLTEIDGEKFGTMFGVFESGFCGNICK